MTTALLLLAAMVLAWRGFVYLRWLRTHPTANQSVRVGRWTASVVAFACALALAIAVVVRAA